jgi:hypothetical protein
LSGGASRVVVSLPAGVPAQLSLDGGASFASLVSQSRMGVAGGTVLTTSGWPAAANRYEFDLVAGVSSITVTRR